MNYEDVRDFRFANPAALPQLAAVITAVLGLLALAGWAFAVPMLKSVLPGAVEMQANTALGLVAAALALFVLCRRPSPPLRRAARVLALAVAALGLATLGQYVFGWQLGIDELLFRGTADARDAIRGRMSPYSGVAFALIGLGLAASPRPSLRPLVRVAAATVVAIGAVALLGYLWNASELVTDRWLPPAAANAALAFILLGAGTLVANRMLEPQSASRRLMVRGSVEARILAGFIGALALLFVAGGYTYRTSAEFAESARRVAHTQQVRVALGQLGAAISGAELAQRNYMLTGDAKHKDAYTRLVADVSEYERSLSPLVADNPAQMQNLAALGPVIAQRVSALARQVTVFEREGSSAALVAIARDGTIQATREIDNMQTRMDDLEKELLSRREADRNRARGLSLVALLAMLAVATGMLLLLFRGIRKEFAARARAEDALRASEAYNRAIVDSFPDCLQVLTLDARFIYMAAEGCQLMDVDDFHSIANTDWLSLWKGEDHAAARRAVDAAAAGSNRRFQGFCPTFKGTPKWWDVVVAPILDADGNPHRLLVVSRDITERREAEHAVVAAKNEAEHANAAKDTFLTTMSHEIRTPLSGLLGMLELLGLSPLDSEQRRTLEIARESGRGLVRIMDDVLDHAKIEAGKLEIRLEPVSIEHVLRRVRNTYQAVASSKGLELKQFVDPRISPSLVADPQRLRQILNNFVSNALKFTAEGGVEVRADLIARAGGTDTVCLSVKDSGIGITPEAQQRLFQPFEQAEAVTARVYGGTGLGLSISRRLADMMGGTIQVKSSVGEGTTISVTLSLPISGDVPAELGRQATSGVTPVRLAGTPGSDPLVLAVDDHQTNRDLLARQIAVLGLRVQTAVDGREALALWQAGGIALVVTDCNMPQMDGLALSRAIRGIETREGRLRTPIIAWTANVLAGAAAQCHAAGMDDILTKPADLAALKAMLSKWLPSAVPTADGQRAPIVLAELDKIAATVAERAEILIDFMTQTRSDFAGLRAALSAADFPACARIAHRVKGSSGMVGARDLAAACETMEHAAQQGGGEQADGAQAAMDRALQRLEAHLTATTAANEEQTWP